MDLTVGKLTYGHSPSNRDDDEVYHVSNDVDDGVGLGAEKNVDRVSGHPKALVHVVMNHNIHCKNVNANFDGLSSHLALNYEPPLGLFSEYLET